MPPISWVLLKPQVLTPEGRVRQRYVIDKVIRRAIRYAKLGPGLGADDGVEVDDISEDLARLVYEAFIVIVDANRYETTGAFQFSPYLFYFIALAHSLGNRTILVAESTAHLPQSLLTRHTLTYSRPDVADDVLKFLETFTKRVNEIRGPDKLGPSNPIQEYLMHEPPVPPNEPGRRAGRQIIDFRRVGETKEG